jgi:hypothetical protein
MSKFKLFVVLAAAVALMAVPAFAEVQNIKVSGDITLRDFNRSGWDTGVGGSQRGSEDFQMLQTTVNVDADLTDNVSACVGLAAEMLWGQSIWDNFAGTQNADVGIYKAYITLKEFFYAPLTITLGRQPLWFGKGFIVGSNRLGWDPQLNLSANPNGSIGRGREYSVYDNFDAIRATLDFSPWTVDVIYSKMSEINTNISDDIILYGANVGYKFAEYNGEAEAYYFGEEDSDMTAWLVNTREPVTAHTFGIRGSFDPIANVTLW